MTKRKGQEAPSSGTAGQPPRKKRHAGAAAAGKHKSPQASKDQPAAAEGGVAVNAVQQDFKNKSKVLVLSTRGITFR